MSRRHKCHLLQFDSDFMYCGATCGTVERAVEVVRGRAQSEGETLGPPMWDEICFNCARNWTKHTGLREIELTDSQLFAARLTEALYP